MKTVDISSELPDDKIPHYGPITQITLEFSFDEIEQMHLHPEGLELLGYQVMKSIRSFHEQIGTIKTSTS